MSRPSSRAWRPCGTGSRRPRRCVPSYENALKAAEEAARKAKESTGEMKTSAQAAGQALNQVSQIDMSGLVGQTQAMADAMWDAASASMERPTAGGA